MRIRALLQAALLIGCTYALSAAAECSVPVYAPQGNDQITDWYRRYVAPLTNAPAAPPPAKGEIEALITKFNTTHRRGISDPLLFEPLIQQISSRYANEGDFHGLNTAVAEKIGGASTDFSALCIDTRRDRFPDDTFAITMTAVNADNCQHVVTRGLVFTATLVNGSAAGVCRPDQIYRPTFFTAVAAGTNTITFVCTKAAGGCARN